MFSLLFTEPLIWFGVNLVGAVSFLQLARRWPSLMRQWVQVEHEIPKIKGKKENIKLKRDVMLASLILLFLSTSNGFFFWFSLTEVNYFLLLKFHS